MLQLDYSGIEIQEVHVQTAGEVPNILRTFWTKATVNIANGLDFQRGENLHIKFTLLQHAEFQYQIRVYNRSGSTKEGTCRIFMAPQYDENGHPWNLVEQKCLFIELDKFKVSCK